MFQFHHGEEHIRRVRMPDASYFPQVVENILVTWDSCFTPKTSRVNSISPAERPKRSRVAPSEAIPTFLPFPRPETGSSQELQGKTNLSDASFYSSSVQWFISQAWVALCCADTAKMFLLTEIEILFSEWSSEAEQRFYCSPDINKAQHTIKECTVWDILSPEFNFPCPWM